MVIQDWHNAIVISIHAPLQERLRTGFPHRLHCYFNPRSLAGATVKLPLLSMRKANFNPRSLTGATSHYSSSFSIAAHFNPRSLTGATDDGSEECYQ